MWTEPRFYIAIVFFLLYMTMFALLFDVCSLLYNPFGPRGIDVPHDKVGRGIRLLAKSLASKEYGEGRGYPRTMERGGNCADMAGEVPEINLEHLARQSSQRANLMPTFRQSSYSDIQSLGRPSLERPSFGHDKVRMRRSRPL